MKPEETIFDGISDSEMESYQEVLLKFNLNIRVNQLQVMVMLLNAVIIS